MAKEKKKKDEGKLFEEDIKNSIPSDFFTERYKDDTAGFFGVSNPADYRLYKMPYTFLIECKSHKGKSLPLAKIRGRQIKDLYNATQYRGVFGGFLINYRELAETYYISVKDVVDQYYVQGEKEFTVKPESRKSIPVEWCRENGVRIEQRLKRVRYSYDLRGWMDRYYGGIEV